jgi:hypothetical protein
MLVTECQEALVDLSPFLLGTFAPLHRFTIRSTGMI